METILAILIGVGLSATSGFRVFLPLLGIGLAVQTGHVGVAEGFEWVGSWPAITAFGVAAILEIIAYYVPWLDNLLDTIATPAAAIAGTIMMAAMITDMSPLVRWSLAIIAGGGTAATVKTTMSTVRAASTATTGGLANPIVATGELVMGAVATVLSIVMPVLAIVLMALVIGTIMSRIHRRAVLSRAG